MLKLCKVTPERGKLLRGCRRNGSAASGLPHWISVGSVPLNKRSPSSRTVICQLSVPLLDLRLACTT